MSLKLVPKSTKTPASTVGPNPKGMVFGGASLMDDSKEESKYQLVSVDGKEDPLAAIKQSTRLGGRGVMVARKENLSNRGSSHVKIPRSVGLNGLVTVLTVGASVDGTAATAYTTVINVRPGGTSEYSSFGAVYDEVKVLGGSLHYIWRIKTSSASEGTAAVGIIAYDPLQNSTLSSVENGVQHSQHQWCALPQNDAVPGQSATVTSRAGAMQHFKFKVPSGTQRVPGTAGVISGDWCDTTTTTADWGYIKPYINAVSGQTFFWTYSLELLVEFRSRS